MVEAIQIIYKLWNINNCSTGDTKTHVTKLLILYAVIWCRTYFLQNVCTYLYKASDLKVYIEKNYLTKSDVNVSRTLFCQKNLVFGHIFIILDSARTWSFTIIIF